MGREGFEPPKAKPSGLQPDPVDHFGTDPKKCTKTKNLCLYTIKQTQNIVNPSIKAKIFISQVRISIYNY